MVDIIRHKKAITAIVLVVVILICSVFLYKTGEKLLYPRRYSEYVQKYSEMFGVDENLIYAVIRTESSFNEDAKSDAGAIGLMQITPDTFMWLQIKLPSDDEMGPEMLLDPEINIRYGTFFLSLLSEEFGSDRLAIAAYHAGRGMVNSWLEDRTVSSDGQTIDNIPSRATNHYVDKVSNNRQRYEDIYG